MKPDLIACPFCGTKHGTILERDSQYFVLCQNCGAEGPFIDGAAHDELSHDECRAAVAKAWNERHHAQELH